MRVVKLLLDAGADVNGARRGEGTPLCRAALFGRREIAAALLEKGAKANVVCDADHGDTALMDALRGAMFGGLPDGMRESFVPGVGEQDATGDEAAKLREVLNAPREDFLGIARLLLARGADVNVVANCDGGETALLYATLGANAELVKDVLARGADVNRGASALGMMEFLPLEVERMSRLGLPALSKGQAATLAWWKETAAARAEIGRLLKAAGAKDVTEEGETEESASDEEAAAEIARAAFDEVVEKDDVEDLKRLANAYAAHPLGASALPEALRLAVVRGRTEMVKILLGRGVDPNRRSARARGYTPLMHAAQDGEPEYVRLLLEAGADVGLTNDDGETALDLAEGRAGSDDGHRAVVKLLRAADDKRRQP